MARQPPMVGGGAAPPAGRGREATLHLDDREAGCRLIVSASVEYWRTTANFGSSYPCVAVGNYQHALQINCEHSVSVDELMGLLHFARSLRFNLSRGLMPHGIHGNLSLCLC